MRAVSPAWPRQGFGSRGVSHPHPPLPVSGHPCSGFLTRYSAGATDHANTDVLSLPACLAPIICTSSLPSSLGANLIDNLATGSKITRRALRKAQESRLPPASAFVMTSNTMLKILFVESAHDGGSLSHRALPTLWGSFRSKLLGWNMCISWS